MTDHSIIQDHYAILNLPSSLESATVQSDNTIKLAYRRALLQHHPDKSAKSKHSVDQVITAYKILIDPAARFEYDKIRASQQSHVPALNGRSESGVETVDLDDMSYDEVQQVWYRSCRCGIGRSYLIAEDELEPNAEYGEIFTGCLGCSIWLRVTFAVADG